MCSMKNNYPNQSLSAPVRERRSGKRICMLLEVPVGGADFLHEGDEFTILQKFKGGVSVRTPKSNTPVVLHDGSFEFI